MKAHLIVLLAPFLFLALVCSAQTPAPATASIPNVTLPCFATKTNMPKGFSGFFGTRKSKQKPVNIAIGFSDPPNDEISFPCVGEPLEVTVPNGQAVQLEVKYSAKLTPCSLPVITVTNAPSDLSLGDLITMGSKLGIVALVETKEPVDQTVKLPALTNKTLSLSATCPSDSQLKFTQAVKITYQNPPRLALSGGFVAAPGVKSFGIKTTQTGVGTGGVVTTQNSLVQNGAPGAQVIPFSFANIYYAGSRNLNLNGQFGLGVNPNLSSARVEFFASPVALSWHDVYFSPGFHIGQHEKLTGGFTPGELTPSSLSKVPIGWSYFAGFGFSLSYNLKPLVKSSSSASGQK